MKLTHTPGSIRYRNNDTCYTFLSTGDIYRFESGSILINGFTGSQKEGSANNIWLRLYTDDGLRSYPLLGIASGSLMKQGSHTLCYYGTIDGISYEVTFRAAGSAWFWDVRLDGFAQSVDLIYGQDLGMAECGAVLENELYAAQYLSHTVINDAHGIHICSRQNLPQNQTHPCLQQGLLYGTAVRFSTDALQFFGASYKADNIPCALAGNLEDHNLQFEGAYIALQTEQLPLDGSLRFTFYASYIPDHKDAVTSLQDLSELEKRLESIPAGQPPIALPRRKISPAFGTPYAAPAFPAAGIRDRYPQRILEECDNETLLSFFTPDYTHVVSPAKELLMERPHGNIVTTAADTEKADNRLLTSTHYMYGMFNGQTVVGNTSKHKFLSTPRGLMNLLKNSGQRIYIKIGGVYRLLTLPSLFEMGLNHSRWFYAIGDDTLVVTSYAVSNETKIITDIRSEKGQCYDFILSHQLVLGTHEFTNPIAVCELEHGLRFTSEAFEASPYPGLHYDLYLPETDFTWSDDRIFFEDQQSQNGTLLTVSVAGKDHVRVILTGSMDAPEEMPLRVPYFEQEKEAYLKYYNRFLCGFNVGITGSGQAELTKLNVISRWYAHNALVHFAVPHGLEQPGGAAWGTRDVCQGPMELFMATQKWSLAKDVLLRIFSHQFAESGEWPQWFMFDGYSDCQEECHGDVVFWPLKCIGDYLARSGDVSILDETIPYADCAHVRTLSHHVESAVRSIETRFLEGTHLISYAGGDWDDTLQPARDSLKEHMVSAWTQALAFQVLHALGEQLLHVYPDFGSHCSTLARLIGEDFLNHLVIDGVIAGFVTRCPNGDFAPMLHPNDSVTGIHLRLLPLTRSIIAELADERLAAQNTNLIEECLHFPDGVRLMNRPASYSGGVSKLFRRAEQAANVGREISLQYVHAHIRYIEALCHMGMAKKAWTSLFEIVPIRIKDMIPNAALRQSNLYFSSSDGAFHDRYEYAREFERLRDGSVSVKGGWRIYSSGPGIFLHQLICNVFGIQAEKDRLLLHPALPEELDGLRLHYECFGRDFTFVFHIIPGHQGRLRASCNGVSLTGTKLTGRYGTECLCLERNTLPLNGGEIQIDIE